MINSLPSFAPDLRNSFPTSVVQSTNSDCDTWQKPRFLFDPGTTSCFVLKGSPQDWGEKRLSRWDRKSHPMTITWLGNWGQGCGKKKERQFLDWVYQLCMIYWYSAKEPIWTLNQVSDSLFFFFWPLCLAIIFVKYFPNSSAWETLLRLLKIPPAGNLARDGLRGRDWVSDTIQGGYMLQ